MAIRIAHIKTLSIGPNETAFYVGRPGFALPKNVIPLYILGNPWKMDANGYDRHTVINMYAVWLQEQVDENNTKVIDALNKITEAHKTGNIVLVCWCYPERCHADVIRDMIMKMCSLDTSAIETMETERLIKQGIPDEALEAEIERLIEDEQHDEQEGDIDQL